MRDRLAGARHLDDAAVEAWIAQHPARFARKVAATRDRLADAYTYRAEDGRDHVYLGDLDSYLWLRRARQYLRAGTTCDAVADGDCRDLHTLAPVGSSMRYARSIHIAAIVAVQRIAAWLRPGWPLPSSAMLVPVIVGALGVLPAFALGRRLAGDAGGVCAAIVAGTNADVPRPQHRRRRRRLERGAAARGRVGRLGSARSAPSRSPVRASRRWRPASRRCTR